MTEDLRRSVEAAVEAVLAREGRKGAEVAVTLVDDERIQGLNRTYRKKDAPTDVLSFPLAEGPEDPCLGDVVISAQRAREQAEAYGHGLRRELAFLAVHGTLHLLGWDHASPVEEKAMFAVQEDVLRDLGILR